MDYSSIPNDSDNAAAASPWGSASPRAQRTFSNSVSSDVPPPPFPSQQQSPYTADREVQGGSRSDNGGERGIAESPDLSERIQGSQSRDPDSVEGSPAYPRGNQTQQQHPRTQAPARYQTGARQQQARQSAPKPKLQAKVTALERTGKKDPIIRFDVHVGSSIDRSFLAFQMHFADLEDLLDKHFEVQNYSVSRRAEDPFGVCQISGPSDFLQPGSNGACGTSSANSCWGRYRRG